MLSNRLFSTIVIAVLAGCSSSSIPSQLPLTSQSREVTRAAERPVLFAASVDGHVYGYDLSGRTVLDFQPSSKPSTADHWVHSIAFDPDKNMYVTFGEANLAKYAPPYTGKPVYVVKGASSTSSAQGCISFGYLYGAGDLVYVGCSKSSGHSGFAVVRALDGAVVHYILTPHDIGGYTDKYGNFFTMNEYHQEIAILEYKPPQFLAQKLNIRGPLNGALATDGIDTIYVGTDTNLDVYHSVGLGMPPVYEYSIPNGKNEYFSGGEMVSGNDMLFLSPTRENRCSISHWNVSVFKSGKRKPFEQIPATAGLTCNPIEEMAADGAGNLFVYAGGRIRYFPHGTTTRGWSAYNLNIDWLATQTGTGTPW